MLAYVSINTHVPAAEGRGWQCKLVVTAAQHTKRSCWYLKASVFNDHRGEQHLPGGACSAAPTSQGRHGRGNAALGRTLWTGISFKDALLPSQTRTQISQASLSHFSHGGPISARFWAGSAPFASRGLEGAPQMLTAPRGSQPKDGPLLSGNLEFKPAPSSLLHPVF